LNLRRLICCILFCTGLVTSAVAVTPFETGAPPIANEIDRLVFGQLRNLGLEPAQLCSDAVFVRRVYLDVIGTLPTGYEAQEFLLSKKSDKRSALIDQLLEREEFADYWAMKWSDVLRIKAEFPINLWPNAVQAYHRWLRDGLRANLPYDKFARELLLASGSNFRDPPVNFYRAMQTRDPSGIARTVALTFMGERAEKWPAERLTDLAVFFSGVAYKCTGEWKEEIVWFDNVGTNAHPSVGVLPDGKKVALDWQTDPRGAFVTWLVTPENPWFSRNVANRCWAWLLGRGIIHEPDDARPDNPPANAALLSWLEKELVRSKFDLKQLFRVMLNSSTYQLSSIPANTNATAAVQFASYPIRRLEAEVLIDALNQITGSTEHYSSAIPEPFTYIPESHRAISLADGSITSSFLEMFGRAARDTGLESERNNNSTAAQSLHLLNSSHILRKIEQSRMVTFQTEGKKTPRVIANSIYLGVLSRFPTDEEIRTIETYAQSSGLSSRELAVDVVWALINSAEFLFRH
jgi:hypothetical protein